MRSTIRFRAQLLLGGALLAIAAGPALAADRAAAPAAAANPAPAEPAAAADQTGIQDVVVTALRRETNLQHTPIAISVVDSATITDRHVQSLMDLADGGVPSLRVATFEARQSALTIGIRGIVPFDQNQTAREPGVGVYIDGVYLGRTQGLNAALFDVSRIEVLKGPQGTLFGRNTEGGALSIVTKGPTGEFGGRASSSVGNYGSYSGDLHLDLPEFQHISIKLDGVIQHHDPTVKDPLAGQIGWNAYNRVGGRIAARWQPFDGFTADLAFDKAKDENTPFYSQLINYNPTGLPVGTYVGTTTQLQVGGVNCTAGSTCIAPLAPLVKVHPDRQDVADVGVPQQYSVDKTQGFSANLKYHFSPALELRSITAWRKVSTNQFDNSGGPERTPAFQPNGKFSRYSLSDLYQSQFSQEFQAVGSIPQFDYVAGLYYFHEQARESAGTPSSNQWNGDGTAYTILPSQVFGPINSGNQGWNYNSRFLARASFATARSYAAFGQVTYNPDWASAFHLTAGGRYTKDKRDGSLYIVTGVATPYELHTDNSRFDPMVTLAFDASPDINLYAKYASGYRAGGANDRSSNFQAFGPEVVKSYELGAKMDFFDHKVRLNLAGYIMDRTGTQIDFDFIDPNQCIPNSNPCVANPNFNIHTQNTANAAGVTKIRGIEADLTIRPIEHLTLGASYAYTYTRVPPTPNPNPNTPGQTPVNGVLTQVFIVYTPEHAASGYADYEIPLGGNGSKVRFHLDANYSGKQHSFDSEALFADPSFIVNGRVALADIPVGSGDQKVTLSVWARNLFDEQHIYRVDNANAKTLGYYANFNAPRTFGGEVSVKF
ncbi:MAG: TonB-dependent receptor [Sphingomonas bacterium]|uniref:TonB-dependent receptor n=1 Tax=Sphingomonas bacterium TaxID=1895847 RepID=UPI0026035A99|nr:TonB-dependent receptor [Sphingomonas bacterium]MDB5712206.1 TonB-dependent receptor [Sphingomonas bacterium]